MKTLLTSMGLLLSWPLLAQWAGSTTITLDGNNSESCYVTSGNWSIAWDNSYLYIVKKFGATNQPSVLYFDIDPQYPVTWGTNSNGSLSGYSHWDIQPNLPFRADLCIYWEYNYAEYATDNGSGGWNSPSTFSSGNYAYNSTFNSDREIRISWTSVFGLSGRPASFNFAAYANTRGTLSCSGSSNVGCIYDQTPEENPQGACGSGTPSCFRYPNLEYYWRCNNTSSSGTHNPFDYRCYTYLGSGGALGNMGVSPLLYDFTLNKASTTVNKNGKWVFRGYMCVSDGTIEFDNNADSLIVEDSLTVMGTGKIDMESATSKVWVKRDLSNRALGTPGTDFKLSDNSSAELGIGGNFRNYAGFEAATTPVVMNDPRNPQTMQMIQGNFKGDSALYSLQVNNSAGLRIWPDDSLVVRNTLTMSAGKLDVDEGKYLRLRHGCTVNNTGGPGDGRFVEGWLSREIHSTDSTIFHVGDGSSMARVAIQPASAQSGRAYTVRYVPSGHEYSSNLSATRVGSSGLDHASFVEYWKIFCDHTTDDAELTLFWTTHSVVSATSSDWQNLRVSRWVGNTTNEWTIDGNSPYVLGASTSDGFVDAKSNTVSFADSIFTIGSTTTPNPLPVELLDFSARWENEGQARVSWTTATEINNRGFELYHSTDGQNWEFLEWFLGQGNSSELNHYSSIHNILPFPWVYFQLIQIDEDEQKTKYGPVVLKGAQDYSDIAVCPNPCTDWIFVCKGKGFSKWKIKDGFGRELLVGHFTFNERIPTRDLLSGHYILELNGENLLAKNMFFIKL